MKEIVKIYTFLNNKQKLIKNFKKKLHKIKTKC